MTNRLGRIIIGGDVDFLSRPGVVPARNLCGHGERASALVESISTKYLGDCGRLPFGSFTEYLTLYENSLDSLSAVCYATGRMPLATLNARSQQLERLELSFSVNLPEVYNE
jgi:hypothetical protein